MPQKLFLPLLIVAGLVVTSLVSANWTPPTGLTPPDCPAGYPGCDAPINVSIVDQFKLGSLGVNKFFQSLGKLFVSNNLASTSPDSFRLVGASYDPNYVLMAQGNIGAEKYCDVNGENCKTITELGTASSTPGGGGGVYVGATAVTYNGAEVGGYSGGDAKCNTAFPGSRMATAADFANGRPTVSGWYSGLIYDAYSPYPNNDCVGWADSTAGYFGFYWNAGTPAAAISQCNTKNKILCSMSGTGGGGGGGGAGGVTSLTAGAGITLTPNPITTTGTIAATGDGGGEGVMYLRSRGSQASPTCPAGWSEADYRLQYASLTTVNNVRTCYTNNICRVMYLGSRSIIDSPAACPVGWSEASDRLEYIADALRYTRTCYKCN